MPEFVLDLGDSQGARTYASLSSFEQGYIEAAFFTSTGPDNEAEGLGEGSSFGELAPSAIDRIKADCAAFEALAADLLALAYATDEYDATQAGRDFWFTRNGHGVGFWDREQLEKDVYQHANGSKHLEPDAFNAKHSKNLGGQLSDLCRYSEVDLVRGDDGLIYLE
jgi:hypothetical protein